MSSARQFVSGLAPAREDPQFADLLGGVGELLSTPPRRFAGFLTAMSS
jgi:hypothetical protein